VTDAADPQASAAPAAIAPVLPGASADAVPAPLPGPGGARPPSAPAARAATPRPAAAPVPGADQRVHVYEAVANQRHNVLSSFDAQRQAIFKAVADQRETALAPILATQAKLTALGGSAEASRRAAPSGGAVRPPATPQQMIAADIVAALKALVADEVRAQLAARLPGIAAPADPAAGPAGAASGTRASAPPTTTANTALVATLKVMVAEEVAAQLDALLRTVASPTTASPPVAPR